MTDEIESKYCLEDLQQQEMLMEAFAILSMHDYMVTGILLTLFSPFCLYSE